MDTKNVIINGKTAIVKENIFTGKQNIPWNDVERYLKKYIGQTMVYKIPHFMMYVNLIVL